jgi:hypothetical protein
MRQQSLQREMWKRRFRSRRFCGLIHTALPFVNIHKEYRLHIED